MSAPVSVIFYAYAILPILPRIQSSIPVQESQNTNQTTDKHMKQKRVLTSLTWNKLA